MAIRKEKKETIIKNFRQTDKDTGSVEVQVALLTENIRQLTEHFKINPKDFHSKRGMLKMVSQRKNFLKYLERTDKKVYQGLMDRLAIRK
jgi:small subunit ribosomal protein S15